MILSFLADHNGTPESQLPRLDLIVRATAGLPPSGGRLGVLGGSYNPPTRAHLVLARAAVAEFNLHEVVFVLSELPPHKSLIGASIDERLKMMRLGTIALPFISVGLCTHGLFLDICVALRQVYPHHPELFFITGRDAAERILTWHYEDPEEALASMFAAFQLLVFDRQGELRLPNIPLFKKYASRIHSLTVSENLDHVSSSKVRERIRVGLSIRDLVPREVAAFIEQNNIYTNLSGD
ncbi:MAG: nicotinate-nicotinamide nucleotide adenylyltransferase [Deltaproteobacteria bacterium]|nr:MAG: nicotinate-nicotinamide nucleotide adenylyltransferase [Deltaproteobacteria bacterium]